MHIDGGGTGVKEFENRSFLGELKHMKDRMDSLLSEVFECGRTSEVEVREETESQLWEPRVDLWETHEAWFLVADLPGVREEDLKVELVESRITIQGRREPSASFADQRIHQAERPQGSFCRSFALPPNMKMEPITAELKNGVLTISILKDDATPARPFKIEVRSD
jgi:HSP20 family protein